MAREVEAACQFESASKRELNMKRPKFDFSEEKKNEDSHKT